MADGRFIWYELATPDVEGAKTFYGDVVGWNSIESSAFGTAYTLFTSEKTPVSGLLRLPDDARQHGVRPSWTGYVGVDDVDATADRVRQLGGAIYVPPTEIANVSRFSVIADPQSATLALLKWLKSERERDVNTGALGRVGWHELLATDWQKAWVFYSAVFGWQKALADTDVMGTYQLFSDGAEIAGGMFTKPVTVPAPFWLYYFNISDVDEAANRVIERGGQVINGPIEVPDGCWIFQCADPQGAIFGLVGKRRHKRVIIASSGRNWAVKYRLPRNEAAALSD